LKTLLIVVVLLGLSCAALANPSRYWAVAAYLATLAVFPAAAWLGRESDTTRPFALGFAITGFLYFSLCHLPVVCGDPNISMDDLPTTWLLRRLQNWMGQAGSMSKSFYFMVVGHCLWTLIFATIGGLAASWLQRPPNTNPQDQP